MPHLLQNRQDEWKEGQRESESGLDRNDEHLCYKMVGRGGAGGCMRKEHQEKGMWQREIYGKSKIAERREGWQGWIFNEGSGVCSLIMQPAGGNKRCVGFPCVSVSTPLIHHSHSCLLDLSAAPRTWLRPQQLSSTPSLTTAVSEGRINSGGRGGRSRLINFVVYFVVGDSVWYQLDVRKYISAWQPKTQCVLVWPFLTQKMEFHFPQASRCDLTEVFLGLLYHSYTIFAAVLTKKMRLWSANM